jgi:hypothetical protein
MKVDWLVCSSSLLIAVDDPGGAYHHDPMLGAVMVHLQRERRAGLDFDALDLEARSFLEHGVGAPGARRGAVLRGCLEAACLELGDQRLDVLHLVAMRHQQRVGVYRSP